MRCEQVMKRSVKCLTEAASIRAASILMRDHNIGFIPVCDDQGRAVGVVTDRDIVLRVAAENGSLDTPVASIMSTDLVTCGPTDSLAFAEVNMRERRKSRILVVDEYGRPVGVISLSDLAQSERPGRMGRMLRALTTREAHA